MAPGKKTAGTEGGTGGAGGDADEDEDDADEHDIDADEDDEDEDEAEYVAPTKEQHLAMQAALSKANAQAKKYRLRAQGKAPEKGTKPDADAEQKAEDRARELAKPHIVRAEATRLLAAAGANVTPKLLRLIDLDEVDVDDDDGSIDGLDDQIDELKEDYPNLFAPVDDKPAPRRRAGRLDTSGSGKGKPTGGKSATERQVAALNGGRK